MNQKKFNARLYARRPNMEAKNTLENRPPIRKNTLIESIDVYQCQYIYKLKNTNFVRILHVA